ncbi:hypothetical protein BKA83DRAFT_1530714 [Pisolithus microcarpus]|nr:hypothetical protein BKA83DRAFT_1530714 [Pisolithus microcarpus]
MVRLPYITRLVSSNSHFLGCLDSPYLITHLTRCSVYVLSLTAISIPHCGSHFATHFLSLASTFLSLRQLFPFGGGDGKGFDFRVSDTGSCGGVQQKHARRQRHTLFQSGRRMSPGAI